MDTFSYLTATATIARPAICPFESPAVIPQIDGMDSAGNRYVYEHGVTTRPVALVFPRVTIAELIALQTFLSVTVAGSRRQFNWIDPAAVTHVVRLVSWKWLQVSPSWYRLEIHLEETL
jgi:hypothetical protein